MCANYEKENVFIRNDMYNYKVILNNEVRTITFTM